MSKDGHGSCVYDTVEGGTGGRPRDDGRGPRSLTEPSRDHSSSGPSDIDLVRCRTVSRTGVTQQDPDLGTSLFETFRFFGVSDLGGRVEGGWDTSQRVYVSRCNQRLISRRFGHWVDSVMTREFLVHL